MNKTFFTFSLGCKVNSYELNAISSKLISLGYKKDKENPEYILINTCSVTATADQKSRQHIRKFKSNYPNSKIVVLGCYAQGNVEYIKNELDPFILVGTSNKDKIVDYILKDKKIIDVNPSFKNLKYEELGISSFCENTRAYLKIEDGCSNFCSYCLIPFLRGNMRSREAKYVLKECEFLLSKGYKEIVISGIDIGSYGKDLGDINFSTLLESILFLPKCKRVRISSIEASQIDEKLILLLERKNNLAKHLHIPLQSGSKDILKAMNRKYDVDDFYKKIMLIRKSVPDFALTGDVIVGFPGESEENFKETYSFIKKCGFNMLHVFPYSKRKGTYAAILPNQIDENIKKQRVSKLIDLSNKLWKKYTNKFIGRNVDVLVEKFDKKNNWYLGHTSNYIEVKLQNIQCNIGDFVTIKLEKNMIVSD